MKDVHREEAREAGTHRDERGHTLSVSPAPCGGSGGDGHAGR